MENTGSFVSILFLKLVSVIIRIKSYNLTHSHTHSNNHMVTGSNGPQMLCPGLSEEDILMTACWSCQIFTGTQQKKEGRDNVQMRTLFTFKLVSSGTDILYITLCLEMEQCTIQREHHACRNKPKGSFRSHSLTL